jgi:hypothetical protein
MICKQIFRLKERLELSAELKTFKSVIEIERY